MSLNIRCLNSLNISLAWVNLLVLFSFSGHEYLLSNSTPFYNYRQFSEFLLMMEQCNRWISSQYFLKFPSDILEITQSSLFVHLYWSIEEVLSTNQISLSLIYRNVHFPAFFVCLLVFLFVSYLLLLFLQIKVWLFYYYY